jgi:hypothetical protein
MSATGLEFWMCLIMLAALGLAVYFLDLGCRDLRKQTFHDVVADDVSLRKLEERLQILEARLVYLEEVTRGLLFSPSPKPAPDRSIGRIPKPSATSKPQT